MPIGVAKTEQKGNYMGVKRNSGAKYGKRMGKKCDQAGMRTMREKGHNSGGMYGEGGGD